jgi:pilus assembly protein CpaF
VESDVIEVEPIFTRVDGELLRVGGQPPHSERYARVGVDLGLLLSSAVRS